ncbi:MAG: hypothetical protein WBM83_01880 [Flavobacteriaceae bacterium]
MVLHLSKYKQRHVLLKTYPFQKELVDAIEIIRRTGFVDVQLSVLGKLDDFNLEDSRQSLIKKENLKTFWRQTLGSSAEFGFFSNPELGTMYIVGPLITTFLHDVEGTKLGALSSGPYGILRGLGIAAEKASEYIKFLDKGGFLLILRGYDKDLKRLGDELFSLS